MTTQARFEAIQARYRAAKEREEAYRLDTLLRKYGQCRPPSSWLTRTESKRLESFRAAQDRCGDALFLILDDIGRRAWRVGAPYWWIMSELTYADAITTGPLSVIPPSPYGYSRRDTERFSGAVTPIGA